MKKKIAAVERNVTTIELITGEEVLVFNDQDLIRGAQSIDKHSTVLALSGNDFWASNKLDCRAILKTREPIELIRPDGDSIYINPTAIVKIVEKAYTVDFDESDLKYIPKI